MRKSFAKPASPLVIGVIRERTVRGGDSALKPGVTGVPGYDI